MKLLSLIYGFIIFLRNKLYDFGIKKSEKVSGVEIICIGNIVVGGAGKTPAVQYFVKKYILEGKKVGILSRGYKGKREKDPYLVRDYKKIYATPIESGDEAYLHALNLQVPVVVSKNRVEGAKYLRDKFGVDIIVMDDGFQHRKILKDKNIVLVDATNPFGNNEYLPKGRLRESLNELKRADKIIISKSNYVKSGCLKDIKDKLAKYKKEIKVAVFDKDCFYKVSKIIKDNTDKDNTSENKKDINHKDTDKINIELEEIKDKNVLIFSSIANPKNFYDTIQELGAKKITEKIFSDHYVYTENDINDIIEESKKYDYVLTTEKDIVKINKNIENLLVLKMKFEILQEEM